MRWVEICKERQQRARKENIDFRRDKRPFSTIVHMVPSTGLVFKKRGTKQQAPDKGMLIEEVWPSRGWTDFLGPDTGPFGRHSHEEIRTLRCCPWQRGGEREWECQENDRPGRKTGKTKWKRQKAWKWEKRESEREWERSMMACFWWDSKSQHLFGWGSEKSSVSPCSARGNAIPGCMGFYEKQLYVEKGRWREPEKERQQGKEGEQESEEGGEEERRRGRREKVGRRKEWHVG